jgi:PspA-Associated protein
VIVRIVNEGQFEVPDDVVGRLNELDNEAVAAVEAGDEGRFQELFDQMQQLVKNDCSPVPDDELVVSEVIIPPADLTFEEAQGEFTGDGLIPD